MSGNSIGKLFTVTGFGESHGPALGCIVDGCPPGLALSESDLQGDLDRRKPGQSRHTTQRREADEVQILSGVFEGKTTGAPIGLIIAEFAVIINQFDGSLALLQSQGIQMTPYWLGMVPFVWFVSKGAAAANRIENAVPIFGTIAALAVILVGGIRYMAM